MNSYSADELIAVAIAVSFAAGLNVYAVVATLGLLSQFGVVTLPGPIAMLDNWWVIGISLTLFVVEFFADKIPMFDLIWNALQVFVRVPAGALLAFGATSPLPPSLQLAAAVGGGALALASASGKIALRGSVTASPEPFSNIALSVAEDALAIGLTWFALSYPWLAAAIALTFVVIVLVVARWAFNAIRAMFRSATAPRPDVKAVNRID
jgi:Domain of unknown function (DUF4126)